MKEKIEMWVIMIPARFIFFILRIMLKIAIRFCSQERLYAIKLALDDSFSSDDQSVDEWVNDLYTISSEENLYWMWITAEAIEDFYKKSSWIQIV